MKFENSSKSQTYWRKTNQQAREATFKGGPACPGKWKVRSEKKRKERGSLKRE